MALTATSATTALGITPGPPSRFVTLTSATGALVNMFLKLDSEFMRITDTSLTPTLGVNRGDLGSSAVAHNAGAYALFGNAADFLTPGNIFALANDQGSNILTYFINPVGTQTLPTSDSLVLITKATALAATFALPTIDQSNSVQFVSTTTAAHVLTCTAGWGDGATGAPHTTATFAAFKGAGFTAVASNGIWNIQANIAVVFT
jgi:hypothetical protein